MFGRTKCRFCGSKDNLARCECGKHFCPVHGVGGVCMECYSSGLVRSTQSSVSVQKLAPEVGKAPRSETATKPKTSVRKGAPRRLRARIEFGELGREETMNSLSRVFRGHHFLSFAQRRVAIVEKGKEIEVLFHGDRVYNSIPIEEGKVTMLTDVSGVPSRAVEAIGRDLSDLTKGMSNSRVSGLRDAYRAVLHHNEMSYLVQTILLAKEAEIAAAELDWEIGALPVRVYGPLCPWCGTSIASTRGMCRFCNREVPETISAGQFIRRHLRRQFGDKLVGIKMLYREGDLSPSEYNQQKAQIEAARDAVERVSWSGRPGA